jgi:hypothetical protein
MNNSIKTIKSNLHAIHCDRLNPTFGAVALFSLFRAMVGFKNTVSRYPLSCIFTGSEYSATMGRINKMTLPETNTAMNFTYVKN